MASISTHHNKHHDATHPNPAHPSTSLPPPSTSITSPLPSNNNNNNKLHSIILSQKQTLHLFLSNPATRTPVIVLYVASFGGALHAAVTTYFYLAIGATEMDIGQLGFIMSVGSLIGSPISGMALDRYGPWLPISVTAGACAWGCLWRGVAGSLASLRMGAILLGIGINLWTVVLGHLVKSSNPNMRSEVLAGFAVQTTVLQLVGKGIFPLAEYGLHHVVGLEDSLLRYRIHMGMCTFFCFYGTFALFWDRKNVKMNDTRDVDGSGSIAAAAVKYQHKHSDVIGDEFLEAGSVSAANVSQQSTLFASSAIPFKEIELATTPNNHESNSLSLMSDGDSGESCTGNSCSTSSSFLNEPKPLDNEATSRMIITESSSRSKNTTIKSKHLLATTITLTFALLLQSIATTIFTVLWPLLAYDRFDLSAHTFGIMTFMSSVVSTGAVAAFPVVERLEKIGGRVRCSAWGFGVGAILCLVFCFCSFGDYWGGMGMDLIGTQINDSIGAQVHSGESRILEQHDTIKQLHSQKQLGLHALSAMAFQAALCFLEPSLKSILSLVVTSSSASPSSRGSSLGGTIGFMQTLGSIGGMIGNIGGTMLYKFSKDMTSNKNDGKGWQIMFQGGSLPFAITAFLMAVSSILIWRLEEPAHFATGTSNDTDEGKYRTVCDTDVESGRSVGNTGSEMNNLDSMDDSEKERPDGCCLALRETTYDLKLD